MVPEPGRLSLQQAAADPVDPSPVDRCHYDVVIAANDENELRERMTSIRERFIRDDNPAYQR